MTSEQRRILGSLKELYRLARREAHHTGNNPLAERERQKFHAAVRKLLRPDTLTAPPP